MRYTKIKQFILLLGLMMPTIWCDAIDTNFTDGHSHINVKESHVQGTPRGTSIQASLDGHWLTVTFTQDIGTLTMGLETASGSEIFNYSWVATPDCYQFYLQQTGDYIITFTLPNGDEYYGEFTITD